MANLYILESNIITCDVALASSSHFVEDTTKLWHMWLWHMGEQGMVKLCKHRLLDGMKSNSLEFCEHCLYGK